MPAPAHCPHCMLLLSDAVEHPYPARPERCPHCHLIVGPGRARADAEGEPGMRGAAAGVYASMARREQAEPIAGEEIGTAIRGVASQLGCRVERLLMIDYQRIAEQDGDLPALPSIIATFGSWKAARRAAVQDQDQPARVAG